MGSCPSGFATPGNMREIPCNHCTELLHFQVLALCHFIFHMFVAEQMGMEHHNLQTVVAALSCIVQVAAQPSNSPTQLRMV